MPLILAMEPDRQQAELLASLCPRHIDAELVLVPSVERALRVLETRVPDLLLTPLLLSSRDDAALTARVRELDDRGIPLSILMIPVLSIEEPVAAQPERTGGLLTRMRRPKPAPARPKGCRPEVFAEQIREYLSRAAAERRDREEATRLTTWTTPEVAATAPLLAELLPLQQPSPAVTFVEFEQAMHALEVPAEEHHEIVIDTFDQIATSEPDTPAPGPELVVHRTSEPLLEELVPAAAVHDSAIALTVDATTPTGMEVTPAPPVDASTETTETSLAVEADKEQQEDQEDQTDLREASGENTSDDDEIWMPLPVPASQLMAPLEGPSLKRRAPRHPARTRKANLDAKSAQPARAARARRARPAAKPMQDEWGLYDPEQCGFAALLERLEELTEPATAGSDTGGKR
jgi:hypothetical protein